MRSATPPSPPNPSIGSLAFAASILLAGLSPGEAQERTLRLQGLFCNTEAQIDAALLLIGAGLPPAVAAERGNADEVACTHVDRLRYIVRDTLEIGPAPGLIGQKKFAATLTAVQVGERLIEIAPPVEVFFVIPGGLPEAVADRRA